MKFRVLTETERYVKKEHRLDRLRQWHDWFAWYPVMATSDRGRFCVWLETVARKGYMYDDAIHFDHRILPNERE